MHDTPSYRGSKSSVAFEGVHSTTSSSIADLNYNELFIINTTGVTCTVDLMICLMMFVGN